ncbi:MAG TPA: hypothetical protein VK423_05195 [Thermoplasmata archaeon]|nr:hypothetical protein [Thermoplasmata archaeon]
MPAPPSSTYIAPMIEALRLQPTSVALTGQNRVLLTQVAVGLAGHLNPEFLWFDIRDHRSQAPPWQLALESDLSSTRLHLIDVPEMRLDSEGADRESPGTVFNPPAAPSPGLLDDLSRIPESIRRAALTGEPDGVPKVILLTNAERASAAFDASSGSLRPYIEALNQLGVTVLVTACSRPRENKHDLDLLLRVEGPRDDARGPATVVCEGVRTVGRFPSVPPGATYSPSAFIHP